MEGDTGDILPNLERNQRETLVKGKREEFSQIQTNREQERKIPTNQRERNEGVGIG